MPARHRFTRRSTALLTNTLLIAPALPVVASARSIYDGPGYPHRRCSQRTRHARY